MLCTAYSHTYKAVYTTDSAVGPGTRPINSACTSTHVPALQAVAKRSAVPLASCYASRAPIRFGPIHAQSKRQSAVSHSTPEAEIVAADIAVFKVGIPALDLWSTIFARTVRCQFHEDNTAAISVCKSGRNPTMRHLNRTHEVDVAALHEAFTHQDFDHFYEKSESMRADLMTKGFTENDRWIHAISLNGVYDFPNFWGSSTAPTGHNVAIPSTTGSPTS